MQYQEAKGALGEAFGTKKAKANLRAQARNRVDVNAMEGVVEDLQQAIEKGSAGLLTQGMLSLPPYLSLDCNDELLFS